MLEALAKIASKTVEVGKEIVRGLLHGTKVPGRLENSESSGIPSQANEMLGSIYKLMVQARQEELERRKDLEKDHKDAIKKENDRNAAIIKALSVKRTKPTPKKDKEKRDKDKQDRKQDTQQQQQKTTEKTKEVKQTAEKQKTDVKETKKTAEVKPTVEKPKVEKATEAPAPQAPKPTAKKEITVGKPSLAKDYAAKAAGAVGALNELGLTNPVGVKAFLQVASKESGLDQVSELGAQAWANTVKKRGAGYANNIFQKNFTEQQYLEAAAKGDEYFFGPNFMSQYSGGWKYRGRGFVGLTHDYNYKNVSGIIKEDIYSNPDLVNKDPKTNAKASLAIVALSIGGGKYEKGLQILNNFKNPQEALEYITANVAAGGTGMDPKRLERIKKRGDFVENLKRAESYGSALDSVVGVPSNQALPATLSTGSQIDQSSKENKDLKDAASAKKSVNVNTTNVTQSSGQKAQGVSDEPYDDRNPHQKKK